MADQVESAGDGAPLPARFGPPPINGVESRLEVLVDVLDQVLVELRGLRLDLARLDKVKEDDPVLEITEPDDPASGAADPKLVGPEDSVATVPGAPTELEPIELTEPAPGPKPAARPTKKAAAKKKAPPSP